MNSAELNYIQRNARFGAFFVLVKPIAQRIQRTLPPCFDLPDLEQYGALGLMAACDRFDPKRAATFRTYAIMKIRGAILEAVSGREYRESTHLPMETKLTRRDMSARTVNLLDMAKNASPVEGPEEIARRTEQHRAVARAVETLTPRQRKVIELRYGQEVTQKEAGRSLGGISQAGARDLEMRAVRRLKRELEREAAA